MFGKKSGGSKGSNDKVFVQNAVKTLVANIRFASVDNPVRVIGVTSSIPNEGKSTVSYSLAQALANGGQTVLLVDCDLRRRSLAGIIGCHAQAGIYGVLSGQVSIEDAAVHTSTKGLYFLDCEPHIPNPVDILSSRRFKNFIAEMREKFTYVVVDTPPLTAFVDAAVISQNVDGMLLVVRQDLTKRDDLLEAYEQLQKAGANVIGCVLNFADNEKSDYYYSYYNKKGKRVRKSKGSSSAEAPKLPDTPLSQQAARPATQAAPRPVQAQQAPRRAAASPKAADDAVATPGLKPLPTQGGAVAGAGAGSGSGSPDSTMSFLAQTGYRPKASN